MWQHIDGLVSSGCGRYLQCLGSEPSTWRWHFIRNDSDLSLRIMQNYRRSSGFAAQGISEENVNSLIFRCDILLLIDVISVQTWHRNDHGNPGVLLWHRRLSLWQQHQGRSRLHCAVSAKQVSILFFAICSFQTNDTQKRNKTFLYS